MNRSGFLMRRQLRASTKRAKRWASVRGAAVGHQATDLLLGEGTARGNALGSRALDESRLHTEMDLRRGGHSLRFRSGLVSPHDEVEWWQCVGCNGVGHSITGDVPPICPMCSRSGTCGEQGFECPACIAAGAEDGFHPAGSPCAHHPLSQRPAVRVAGEIVRV